MIEPELVWQGRGLRERGPAGWPSPFDLGISTRAARPVYNECRPGTSSGRAGPREGAAPIVPSSPRTRPMDGPIGLGVIGCGGFGLFALQQFTQVPGVKLLGMAGTHRPASLAAAARFGVENVDDLGA